MAEGTASVQKMSYEQAAKTLETIGNMSKGKAGDVVLTVHLPEKSTYLKITIPKKAVEEKLVEISDISGEARAVAIADWVNANMKIAVDKYIKSKEKNFKFTIGAVSIAEVVPTKPVEEMPAKTAPAPAFKPPEALGIEEKKVKGAVPSIVTSPEAKKGGVKTVYITVSSDAAMKEFDKDEPKIITVSDIIDLSSAAGFKISIKFNVTEKDLKVDEKAFKKKIEEFKSQALDNALKQGLAGSYKAGDQLIKLDIEIHKAIVHAVGDKRNKLLKVQKAVVQ